MQESTDSKLCVQTAFLRATCRLPTDKEAGILAARLAALREQFAADPGAATKLLAVGEAPRDARLDPIDHAAYTSLCLLILNLDEVQTKQ